MEEQVERFMDSMRSRGASTNTIDAYRRDLGLFAEWFLDTTGDAPRVGAVTALDLAEYRSHLLSGRKPSTVNRRLAALRSFFAWAASEGIIGKSPAAMVRGASEEKPGPKSLGRRELAALLREAAHSGSPRDTALITLLAQTGLRISEAMALTWDDVTLGERSGSVTVRRGKGDKWRKVPLNLTVRKALEGIMPEAPCGGGPIFWGKHGPLTRSGALKMLGRLSRRAGLRVTPHMLRHTFCKSLADAKVPLDQIAMLAGHASLDTTARYTRPTEADLQRAVERTEWM